MQVLAHESMVQRRTIQRVDWPAVSPLVLVLALGLVPSIAGMDWRIGGAPRLKGADTRRGSFVYIRC